MAFVVPVGGSPDDDPNAGVGDAEAVTLSESELLVVELLEVVERLAESS